MQCQSQESVLTAWGGNLVDGDRNSPFASGRVYARNALPCALGDPKHVIGSPGEFPWPRQSGHQNSLVEPLGSSRHELGSILCGDDAKQRRRCQQDDSP